ncbi:hypothetical protein POM88_022525 [Heracleum sosnowskyi]|uniref:F-box domain-containing protein n=1 Tax=Heracleum sosnowskyi TaxID=360622 RepID=A0AAD8IJ03_9APIA|nr:hypothetical protein POM88_022525 [Heracleum sosnowskyi]
MSSTGVLPVDLLEEIFTRLPVKSLITLTIICKSWLALITSQSFAKIHLSRYYLNPNTHLLLLHMPCRETIAIAKLNFLEIPRIVVSPIPISETLPAEALSNSLTPICCARNVQAYQEMKNSLLRLVDSNVGRQLLLDKKTKSSLYTHDKNFKNRWDKAEYVSREHHGLRGIPKASEGELVVAWVAFMVGEALRGWVPIEE